MIGRADTRCRLNCHDHADMVTGSRYADNKELYIIPGAPHTDLRDGGQDAIPFDKNPSILRENRK